MSRPWLFTPASIISGSRMAMVIVSPVTPLLVTPPLSPLKCRQGGEYVLFLSCSAPPGQSRPRVTAPDAFPAAEVAVRLPGPVAVGPAEPARAPERLPALTVGPGVARPALPPAFVVLLGAAFGADPDPAAAPGAWAAAPGAPISEGTPVCASAPSPADGMGDTASTSSPPPPDGSGTRLGASARARIVTIATPAATRLRRLGVDRPAAAPSPAAARRPPTTPTVRRRTNQSTPAMASPVASAVAASGAGRWPGLSGCERRSSPVPSATSGLDGGAVTPGVGTAASEPAPVAGSDP